MPGNGCNGCYYRVGASCSVFDRLDLREVCNDGMNGVYIYHDGECIKFHEHEKDEQVDEPCKTYDAGKTRYELIPYDVLDGLAKVLEIGAEKYEIDNWRKGMRWSRHFGCLLRHLFAWYYHRKDTDDESGQNHLDHALARIIFLRYYQKHGVGTDDRPKKC